MKRAAKWTAWTLGGSLLVVLVLLTWTVTTQSGARTATRVAVKVMSGKLDVGSVDGSITGPLTISNVRYRDPDAGIDASVQHIAIDLALTDLARALVHVVNADLRGIDVTLRQPAKPPEKKPFSLQPPIDLAIDSLAVDTALIRRDNVPLLEITRALFSGHWTSAELAVKQLDLRSPQGEVHFAGRVGQQHIYAGEGHGRFRWSVGERTYAGVVDSGTQGKDATLTLKLSAPLNAELQAQVEQSATWPWRFTLEAPRFDPREELLPGSSLYSLAASLSGHGSLQRGAVSGKVLVNDEPLLIEPLRFTRAGDDLSLDAILRISRAAGAIHLAGTIDTGNEPVSAVVDAKWHEIVMPVAWAGQELHTHGELAFDGSSQAYRAEGALAIGPPERIADIALNIHGSPQTVVLEQFDIVQKAGRLAARGRIELQPQLGWDVTATAKAFDPGAFAVAWRGRVGFDLASQGRMTDSGPDAALRLTSLQGELRGRSLSGTADLSLTPAMVPSGTLALNSGKSELRFRGQRGERIDATVSLDVASLNDWVPNSGGELKAAFAVRGKWPELSITGDARGSDVHAANVRVESFTADAKVDDPRNPAGSLRLDLNKLTAAGFEFSSVQAHASGGPASHRLEVRASGQPLAFEVDLQGARTQDGWAGSLQHLVFDVKDAARLALRQPAKLVFQKKSAELAQACLAEGRIELCAKGALQPDGAMQASYSLANVPLALGNVLATADLPLKLDGTIEGRGEIRRTPQGELFGNVLVQSPSGKIMRHIAATPGDETADAPQTLLSYHGLRLAASLSGADARASVDAQFEPNGSLRGEASLRNLGEAQTPITGQLSGHIPDLAPLAVFAPQLANVRGRADADVRIAGTMQAPKLSGLVSAAELAADIPAVGLHLKNGQLQARPAPSGEIAVSGGIESGGGRLAFKGTANPSGMLEMNIDGKHVLAADIPGARVIVSPDLKLVRSAERTTLSGQVTIPEAAVNLQKLPRGGKHAQAASSDVIVIDAKTREDEAAKVPLFAEITVNIGDKVDLTGFGLQAKVQGRLDVRESPGEPTLASGEMRVAGRYKAYGQDLTIQRGRLLYAWTPVENPRLDIEAIRQVEQVTAGLRIRGSAQSPELTVFSDPPMAQANALSYLVAGKPLEQIGSGDGDADAMQTAARSIGVAGGGLLAKNIGRRLGIDEFSVKDDEVIGGAALTVGQYLSPRVYLSYGIGLFEPGDVITLRYKLSEEFAVQTQRGPEDTRAGIEYRIEK
jgi:translocation and assembly module TamB